MPAGLLLVGALLLVGGLLLAGGLLPLWEVFRRDRKKLIDELFDRRHQGKVPSNSRHFDAASFRGATSFRRRFVLRRLRFETISFRDGFVLGRLG